MRSAGVLGGAGCLDTHVANYSSFAMLPTSCSDHSLSPWTSSRFVGKHRVHSENMTEETADVAQWLSDGEKSLMIRIDISVEY